MRIIDGASDCEPGSTSGHSCANSRSNILAKTLGGSTNCKPISMYLNASTLAGNTHMAASMNIVANTDGKKTEVNQLIELKAELNR